MATVLIDHFIQANLGRYTARDWKKAPTPAAQPGMPDPTINPQGIFTNTEGTPLNMTLAATTISPNIALGGLGLATPFFEVILGFYTYYLPLALYGAWLSVITWDIVRRGQLAEEQNKHKLSSGSSIGWLAVVYLIPVVGPLAYFLFGRSPISRATRYALAIGAPVVYLLVAVLLLFTVS